MANFTTGMNYFIFIAVLALLSWLVFKDFIKTGLSRRSLLLLWGIKLLFSSLFILLNIYYFGNGHLYGDVANFYGDAKILSDFASTEPFEFLKILTGTTADDPVYIQENLSETQIWNYGNNGDFINDNRLIIRIGALIHLLSFNSFLTYVLVFAFISFTGGLLIYKVFKPFEASSNLFLFGLFLIPTINFWGSAPSKECLLILGFGLLVYSIQRIVSKTFNWKVLILLLGTIFLLLFNKPHVGLLILPLSLIVILAYQVNFNIRVLTIITLTIITGITILFFTPDRINILNRISYKQRDLINMAEGGIFFITDSSFCAFPYDKKEHFTYYTHENLIKVDNATKGEYKLFGESEFSPFTIPTSENKYEVYHIIKPTNSYINVQPIDNSALQLFKNIPSSIANVMIRPYPNDPGDPLKVFGFFENMFFLGWLVFVFLRRKPLNSVERGWVYFCLTSAILLILIIGLTTPILGAIARYKMIVTLLLFIGSMIIFNGKLKKT
ncbi:MAG: hypothetical protein R2780_07240 [Crocinitomicaceae bacterium]|nr:hypothetical protein [Crocinitomicaceae bacterium]